MYFKNDYLFENKAQILKDLEEVNRYVGTSEIDDKLGEFMKKYPYILHLDFGLNTKKFYISDRFGARVM